MDPNDFGTVILDKFLPAEVIEGESLPGKTRYIVQNGTQIIQIDRIIDEEINDLGGTRAGAGGADAVAPRAMEDGLGGGLGGGSLPDPPVE